jgi:hydroxypyruvate isomerase
VSDSAYNDENLQNLTENFRKFSLFKKNLRFFGKIALRVKISASEFLNFGAENENCIKRRDHDARRFGNRHPRRERSRFRSFGNLGGETARVFKNENARRFEIAFGRTQTSAVFDKFHRTRHFPHAGGCEELSKIAGEINCPYIVVVPGKLPEGATKDEIVAESVRVLNELADIAEKYNVSLAFEFLGQTDCSVQTLDLCNEIVEKVNRESVGNVLDTFHFYAGNSTFEAIERMKPEKLFIFHINDAENLPKENLTDAHRLYPGEGILPIREIKARFDKIGYDRMVSIEIFRPEYWNENPFEVAKKAKAATENVLGLSGKTANA